MSENYRFPLTNAGNQSKIGRPASKVLRSARTETRIILQQGEVILRLAGISRWPWRLLFEFGLPRGPFPTYRELLRHRTPLGLECLNELWTRTLLNT